MSPLTVRLLGDVDVRLGERPLPPLRTRKELGLLLLLALADGAPIERVRLAGALWPDAAHEAALHNLRRSLMLLRDALGEDAARLEAPTARSLRLAPDGVFVDALAFDACIAARDHAGAVELYRGELLPGWSDAWADDARRVRHDAYVAARIALAEVSEPRAAVAHWRAVARVEPLNEPAWRGWIAALAGSGQRAEALTVFRQWRDHLLHEHGLRPEPETLALYESLRREARRPAPPPEPTPVASVRKWSPSTRGLPLAPTPFVGRRIERERVAERVLSGDLVTLLGMGGVGKTRLALWTARALEPELPEGAVFVDLTGHSEPTVLAARAVGADAAAPDALADRLAGRRLLLVLDNAETCLDACRALVAALRVRCPHLRLLVTSREPLALPGEVLWRVPPLDADDALDLFLQRAAAARPDLRPDPDRAAELCRRLDGVPLALELAAARLTVLTLEQLVARLDRRFRLLAGGRDLPERHRSLQVALESSWDPLAPEDQALLAVLSVCPGGWTLEIGQAVAAIDDPLDLLERLDGLAARSLVLAEGGRFRMLESVRLFAGERLGATERDAALGRLLDALRALAGDGPAGSPAWIDRLEAERANLDAAFEGALRMPERRADGLALLRAVNALYRVRGGMGAARQTLGRLLDGLPPETPGYAHGLWLAGLLSRLRGDYDDAGVQYRASLTHSRTQAERAFALGYLGRLARERGDLAAAAAALEESVAHWRATGDDDRVASAAIGLAGVQLQRGDLGAARVLVDRAVAQARAADNRLSLPSFLVMRARVLEAQGEDGSGMRALDEALEIATAAGYVDAAAEARHARGEMWARRGAFDAAAADLAAAEAAFRQGEDPYGLSLVALTRGEALRRQGAFRDAATALRPALGHFGGGLFRAEGILTLAEIGLALEGLGVASGATVRAAAEGLRRAMGLAVAPALVDAFAVAPSAMDFDDAVALARAAWERL